MIILRDLEGVAYVLAALVSGNASAMSSLILTKADTDRLVRRENATRLGLPTVYDTLALTDEQHKMSLFMFSSYKNAPNLQFLGNYEKYSYI